MAELSFQMIRTSRQAKEAEDKRCANRKKHLLLLVMHYLSEEGYRESANCLSKETNLDFHKYEVCDNVDLETILMEYESYYFVKFCKYPRIARRIHDDGQPIQSGSVGNTTNCVMKSRAGLSNLNVGKNSLSDSPSAVRSNSHGKDRPKSQENGVCPNSNSSISNLTIEGTRRDPTLPPLNRNETNGQTTSKPHQMPKQIIDFRAILNQEIKTNTADNRLDGDNDRLLKPLGAFAGYTGEWRDLAMTISREIFLENPNVHWDDIIGLDSAKRLVKEAVVYPIKYPQLFNGILSPWKGLLLYGPPGTGKTLLAKAVATECQTTFFNISASTIVSKWRGDSEKLVRVLFELARFHAPSTIFLDELDSLMSQRGAMSGSIASGGGSEHEGSRRMKTELLMQMDGLARSDDLVFLLAASNIPWELDHAMLRRLEKRILVDLPTKEAREQMFKSFLPPSNSDRSSRAESHGPDLICQIDYKRVAEMTDGYTGSDIRLVCKEAAMQVVRKIFDVLEDHKATDICKSVKLDPVTTSEVEAAIAATKPSAKSLSKKYQDWQNQYGSC